MKQVLLISFLLFTFLSFGQQTYKVTEGKLQFIGNEGQIIIKKNNKFYIFKIENSFEIDNMSKGIKSNLEEISQNEFDNLKKEKKIILSDSISNNVNKFRGKNFICKIDKDSIQIQMLNNEFFLYKSSIKSSETKIYPFIILSFNNKQKIIYSMNCLVAFSNKKIYIVQHKDLLFENYISKDSNKTDANDLYKGNAFSIDEYYKVDTLKNKKMIIKNVFNHKAIDNTFDSIQFDKYFIIGYKKEKKIIYNYILQELNLPNLRAIILNDY